MDTQWKDQWEGDDGDDSDYGQSGSTEASQQPYAPPSVPWKIAQQKNQTKGPKNRAGWSLVCPFAPQQPSASTCWPLLPADLVQHDLPSPPSVGDFGQNSESTCSTYMISSAGAPRTPRPTPNSARNAPSWFADPSAGVHDRGSSGDLIDNMQSMWTEYGEPSLPMPSTGTPLAPRTKLRSFDTDSRSPTTPEEPLPTVNPKFEARLSRTVAIAAPLRQQQQQQRQDDGWDNLPPVNSNSQQPRSVWSWNLQAPEFVPSVQRHPITPITTAVPVRAPDPDLILFDSPPLQPQSLPDVDHVILLDRSKKCGQVALPTTQTTARTQFR